MDGFELNGEQFSDEDSDAIMRFLFCYLWLFQGDKSQHRIAQRALVRRMFTDIGCDYEVVLDEIVPDEFKSPSQETV